MVCIGVSQNVRTSIEGIVTVKLAITKPVLTLCVCAYSITAPRSSIGRAHDKGHIFKYKE